MAQALEDRFYDVVGIFAVKIGDVQVHAAVDGKGVEEFLEHFRFKGADAFDIQFHIIDQIRPAAEVDDDARQGFVHRAVEHAVAVDTLLVAQGLSQGVAEDDGQVFEGMVRIDVEVAVDVEGNVHAAVAGQEVHHVVEEADARRAAEGAGAVDVQRDGNLGLCRFPFYLCTTHLWPPPLS